MPTEAVMKCLKSVKVAESVQMQVILQSAPVLKNVKMSSMFAIPSEYSRMVCSFLYRTGIRMFCLLRGKGRDLVLLYREDQLDDCLRNPQNADFLKSYGYQGGSVKDALDLLRSRMQWFYNRTGEFPHETGVFLGYPLEDVKGFIEQGGRNCSYIGYWKVYSDVARARKMFEAFDQAKETAVAEFFSGKNIREIAC